MSFLKILGCLLSVSLSQVAIGENLPLLKTSEIRDFSELEAPRQKVIEVAINAGKEVAGMPYLYGGNGPADGGFDCSGAMHYILNKMELNPPRTSSDLFLWIRDQSKIHIISKEVDDLRHKDFAHLKPGDLVFWTGTYEPTDGRKTKITHVGMFLGYEKKDEHAVMINATNGRSYRGSKGNGFGVYDFRVPRKGSKSRIVGYGTPPGLISKTRVPALDGAVPQGSP